MDFFLDFGSALQMILWKLMNKIDVGTGTLVRDRKPLGTKQTQVKPNANRGWPIKLVNHAQPQLSRLCPKSSWTPPHKMQTGHPRTGDFNAMGIHLITISHKILRRPDNICHWNEFEIYWFEIVIESQRGQWVNPNGVMVYLKHMGLLMTLVPQTCLQTPSKHVRNVIVLNCGIISWNLPFSCNLSHKIYKTHRAMGWWKCGLRHLLFYLKLI